MKEGINVLSLFDGMSCGMIALERAGIKVNKYYASEIDKYAIKVAMKNYPNTIQLGDVTKVDVSKLPKIDLLIGGSPCQGFSFAGKQLNFEDPRSALFFEYVRLLNQVTAVNSNILFLLENVNMKQEYQDIISTYLGIKPIRINSSLVCGALRDRLYWTNIPNVTKPEDKGILLESILQSGMVDIDKSYCLDANYWKGSSYEQYILKKRIQLVLDRCQLAGYAENLKGKEQIRRVYYTDAKSPCLTAICGGNQEVKIDIGNYKWRKLTPIECERLQTVPDNYTEGVSNTQRYKMLGNGWTVDIIAHIFKGLNSYYTS